MRSNFNKNLSFNVWTLIFAAASVWTDLYATDFKPSRVFCKLFAKTCHVIFRICISTDFPQKTWWCRRLHAGTPSLCATHFKPFIFKTLIFLKPLFFLKLFHDLNVENLWLYEKGLFFFFFFLHKRQLHKQERSRCNYWIVFGEAAIITTIVKIQIIQKTRVHNIIYNIKIMCSI